MNNQVVYIGLLTTFMWFLVSLFIQRNSMNTAVYSASIFAMAYIVGNFVFQHIHTNITPLPLYAFQIYGLVMTVIWFCYVLFVQGKSTNRALYSAGKFLVFFTLAELTYRFIYKNL